MLLAVDSYGQFLFKNIPVCDATLPYISKNEVPSWLRDAKDFFAQVV